MSTVLKTVISLAAAEKLAEQAINEAHIKGFSIVVSVVDRYGELVLLKRMDDSVIGPMDVSIKKARTAALFGFDSKDFGALAQPGQPIYSIENTNGGMISFGGGVTLISGGLIVGAIGVAGASVEEDEVIAKAVASVYND